MNVKEGRVFETVGDLERFFCLCLCVFAVFRGGGDPSEVVLGTVVTAPTGNLLY